MYDEQLSFTRSFIKTKLFETNTEFKFQQNLRIEFTKNDEIFKSEVFRNPWLDSKNIKINNTHDELLYIQHNQLSSRVERWTNKGLDWTFNSITKPPFVIQDIISCEGSSYFLLPKKLRNPMKGLINIQNEDNKCFRGCLFKHLNSVNKNISYLIKNQQKKNLKVWNFVFIKKAMQI